jgi:hypothetical protein
MPGINLNRANLEGASLEGADLSNAGLRGTRLMNAYLSDADLAGATLTGADLRRAVLNRANLTGAMLDQTKLSGASLKWACLRRAYLIKSDIGSWETSTSFADFTGVDFSEAILDDIVVSTTQIGDRRDMVTWNATRDVVWSDCWMGTMAEFKRRVDSTYKPGTQYHDEYTAAIKSLKTMAKIKAKYTKNT